MDSMAEITHVPGDDETEGDDTQVERDDAGNLVADSGAVALMLEVDGWLSHVWMVRAFLKHSDEAVDDEELMEVHRGLYDFMLALGPSLDQRDATRYLRIARKKLRKLQAAAESFHELQPEISGHMNFRMAEKSLTQAVHRIASLLNEA
jgi:hypothetical protein